MPARFHWTQQKEQAAQMCWENAYTWEIAEALGVSERVVEGWRRRPAFAQRLEEYQRASWARWGQYGPGRRFTQRIARPRSSDAPTHTSNTSPATSTGAPVASDLAQRFALPPLPADAPHPVQPPTAYPAHPMPRPATHDEPEVAFAAAGGGSGSTRWIEAMVARYDRLPTRDPDLLARVHTLFGR